MISSTPKLFLSRTNELINVLICVSLQDSSDFPDSTSGAILNSPTNKPP